MKTFLILLSLIPLSALANPLPHTKWIDESASQCPTSIFFGVRKYIFINKCYTRGSDGVVEKGIYAVSGKTLSLSNRRFNAQGNFEFVPRNINNLGIISLSKARFVLNIGGKTWRFRRVLPGAINKPLNKAKNKAIKFSPSRLDAHESPTRL